MVQEELHLRLGVPLSKQMMEDKTHYLANVLKCGRERGEYLISNVLDCQRFDNMLDTNCRQQDQGENKNSSYFRRSCFQLGKVKSYRVVESVGYDDLPKNRTYYQLFDTSILQNMEPVVQGSAPSIHESILLWNVKGLELRAPSFQELGSLQKGWVVRYPLASWVSLALQLRRKTKVVRKPHCRYISGATFRRSPAFQNPNSHSRAWIDR